MDIETTNTSSNKLAVIHVLAALIQNPLLFADNKYQFSVEDFPEQFHKILYVAVEHLAQNGMEKIDYIDIDQFLKQYTVQYKVFCLNKGVEYIQNALAMYDPKKFDYYYHTLKKHSLISKLNAKGIDTKDILDPEIIDPIISAKMYEKFDNLTENDILLMEETKLITLKEEFGSDTDKVENHAGDGLRALKEKLKETPDMGLPLWSPKMTTILRGQRQGCLFIESAPSGYGKALPNSSRIPTPKGWSTVGEIKKGDILFDARGRRTHVLDIFPQGKKQVYEVTFDDGRKVRCCDEHLWSFVSLSHLPDIKKRLFKTATLGEILEKGLVNSQGEYKFYIPDYMPVKGEGNRVVEGISPATLGLLIKNDVENRTKEIDHIPPEWFVRNKAARLRLLSGLAGRTFRSVEDVYEIFITRSKSLCDDLEFLCRSLGLQVEIDRVNTFNEDPESASYRLDVKYVKSKGYLAITNIKKLDYEEEMTCFLVDNKEHLFLTDDFIVTHNSRRGNGEALRLSVPEYYSTIEKKWIKTNLQENVLVISTELEENECQKMWMACIAGVPEQHIKDGRYQAGEEERVDKAIDLIEKSNLYFVSITNFDTDDIINTIKKYKQLYDVNYVFFDYLGESLKITATAARQTKVSGLRTDQILLMMASALKDCAKTLGIYIWTATQLSGDYQNAKQLDAGYLRSAKSIADKADAGWILMPVREQDKPIVDSYCTKGFELVPNFVLSVYKVRAGSFQNIKVYVYFDRSTCQMYDCFVTDSSGTILPVEDTNIEIMLDTTKEDNFSSAFTGDSSSNSEEFDFDF